MLWKVVWGFLLDMKGEGLDGKKIIMSGGTVGELHQNTVNACKNMPRDPFYT